MAQNSVKIPGPAKEAAEAVLEAEKAGGEKARPVTRQPPIRQAPTLVHGILARQRKGPRPRSRAGPLPLFGYVSGALS